MRGYRGFFREMGRTGSSRALAMQLRTGAVHVLRRLAQRQPEGDPVERFLGHYGEDGIRAPEPGAMSLARQAEACRVCGLCTYECARVGGDPLLDPRDAVVAASRLEIAPGRGPRGDDQRRLAEVWYTRGRVEPPVPEDPGGQSRGDRDPRVSHMPGAWDRDGGCL